MTRIKSLLVAAMVLVLVAVVTANVPNVSASESVMTDVPSTNVSAWSNADVVPKRR